MRLRRLVLASACPLVLAFTVPLSSMTHLFTFGDSYSDSGYRTTDLLNVVGNPATSVSGGKTWVQYLAESFPSLSSTYFNFAISGALIDVASLNLPNSPDSGTQIADFLLHFSPPPLVVPWQPQTSLFGIFLGINDVFQSAVAAVDFATLLPITLGAYDRNIGLLYAAGARNFLILTVPPIQRTPLAREQTATIMNATFDRVQTFNAALQSYVAMIPTKYNGTVATIFDTTSLFNTVIDNPFSYGFEDSSTYCPAYTGIGGLPDISLPNCPWPLAEYFWANNFHPCWPFHKILANVIVQTLTSPNNVTIPTMQPTLTVPQTTVASSTSRSATASSGAPTSTTSSPASKIALTGVSTLAALAVGQQLVLQVL